MSTNRPSPRMRKWKARKKADMERFNGVLITANLAGPKPERVRYSSMDLRVFAVRAVVLQRKLIRRAK